MNVLVTKRPLRQRSDYTYKFNARTGRHGWLRLTPAYSVKIVEELVLCHGDARRILDPFCGTGTTALSATYHGHEGVTIDINPFLVWLAQAKTARYSAKDLSKTLDACSSALDLIKYGSVEPAAAPPIHNIDRWWGPYALDFLRLLRAAILAVTDSASVERTLLNVAFCRSLIELSNASFNHQSMSFKDSCQLDIGLDPAELFWEDVRFVLEGASQNPIGSSTVVLGDSRKSEELVSGKFDLIITSPPYANRMSYIRELRPYMYWLGFLVNGRDAGELDWAAIGGTWGIATSRLMTWERAIGHKKSRQLTHVLDKIAHTGNMNGVILAKYVAKYFDDMWTHFQGLIPLLAPGAEVHYVVGNSTFYGSLVATELLYAEMLSALGFNRVECRPLRKRNSKKELVEFDVTGKWKER